MASSAGQFKYDDSRYRCCCNSMHITQVTKVLAIVYMVLSIISSIAQRELNTAIGSGILFVITALMFYGVMKERKMLLLPFIIYQLIYIICAEEDGNVSPDDTVMIGIIVIVLLLIRMALALWFIYIAHTCYKFFGINDSCGTHSGAQQSVYGGVPAYPGQVNYTKQPTTAYITTTSTAVPRDV